MSEDDETYFYAQGACGHVQKGLRRTSNGADMVFNGFTKFTGHPGFKKGKNRNLKNFGVLLNPFHTEPLAIFLLHENDNLGIIHLQSLKIE